MSGTPHLAVRQAAKDPLPALCWPHQSQNGCQQGPALCVAGPVMVGEDGPQHRRGAGPWPHGTATARPRPRSPGHPTQHRPGRGIQRLGAPRGGAARPKACRCPGSAVELQALQRIVREGAQAEARLQDRILTQAAPPRPLTQRLTPQGPPRLALAALRAAPAPASPRSGGRPPRASR